MSTRSVNHATFSIERIFSAAPARIFAAFADPAVHDRWFVKGDGWPVAEYSHDFRVGGREHGRFSPDGATFFINETVYLDIVENVRIVSAYTMATGDKPFSASVATIELLPEDTGTRVIFTEQGAFFDGADLPENREAGWNGIIDALARELGEPAKAA